MKFKNVMLATFLLLAILSIGAISAADDANATLTVNDVAELSQDLDDEAVSIDDADGVNAADDGDILKASVIYNAVDSSNTTIKGTLILTDLSTGKVFKENITVGPIKSNYTHANNTYVSNNITETINQLLNLAQIQAGNKVVTIKSQNVSDPDASRYDNRTYTWFDDGGSERYCVVDGEYGTLWQYNVTVIAESDIFISFNASGGNGTMVDVKVTGGGNFTLPECNFTKEGMTFYGWNIVDYIIKKPGENITLTENITIKAIWLGDVQGKEAWIDYTTDDSVTGIIGNMELTDKSTGQIYSIVVFSDNETSQYSNATPLNTTIGDLIYQFMPKFYTEAQGYAGNCTITIINKTISDPQSIRLWDKRVFNTYELGDSELDYMPIFNETGDIMATRFHYARGSYGKFWAFIITTTAEFESGITSISNAAVVLSKNAFTFNGNVQKPVINTIGGKALIEGTDYTIQWSNPSSKNAATYTVTIIGKGAYTGTTKATYTINKAANPLKIKGKTVKVKFQKLSKKTQKLKVSKVIKFTKKGQGTLTYAKKSGNKKITINKKTGKITIKKGLKKGTYKVKVKVKAKGNANYLASAFKTVTFKIKIK